MAGSLLALKLGGVFFTPPFLFVKYFECQESEVKNTSDSEKSRQSDGLWLSFTPSLLSPSSKGDRRFGAEGV